MIERTYTEPIEAKVGEETRVQRVINGKGLDVLGISPQFTIDDVSTLGFVKVYGGVDYSRALPKGASLFFEGTWQIGHDQSPNLITVDDCDGDLVRYRLAFEEPDKYQVVQQGMRVRYQQEREALAI